MYRLVCNIQKYDWGRKGSESKAALYKKAQEAFDSSSSFEINPNETYAELWMGTHKNCPSRLEFNDNNFILLSDYLKLNPKQSLGENILKHFYESDDERLSDGDLPFLFKVLCINKALSIQAHPNKLHAKQLHAQDPKNYPDPNHKPEMLVAISEEFEAMCGFRLSDEIAENFKKIPQLATLCDQTNVDEFCLSMSETSLRKCFTSMMNKNEQFISEQFNQLKSILMDKKEEERSYLDSLFLRLAQQYPNDVGCFSIYLLNCLKLQKGEAIFLSANIPHAYLFGDGVECMACSDNVVRAGLTPKFKDVNVLCDMLDYRMRSSQDNKLAGSTNTMSLDYLLEFRPSVDEFSVQQIKIERKHILNSENKQLLIPKLGTGSILIVIEMNSSNSFFSLNQTKKFKANLGLVYFIDADTDIYFNAGDFDHDESSTVLLAFRAFTDIKSTN